MQLEIELDDNVIAFAEVTRGDLFNQFEIDVHIMLYIKGIEWDITNSFKQNFINNLKDDFINIFEEMRIE